MQEADAIFYAKKATPVQVWLWMQEDLEFPNCRCFTGAGGCRVIFGDWQEISPVLQGNWEKIDDYRVVESGRNSAMPLLESRDLPARIEPGAILRAGVQVEENAVILMGSIVNVGARIGSGTMIDMGAVVGARAQIGKNCHIGAGAVVAGVLEPPSAVPVVVEDGVLIGANAVILEGCRVGERAVVAAGAVVTESVPAGAVVAGNPARFVKQRDAQTDKKTQIDPRLRQLSGGEGL